MENKDIQTIVDAVGEIRPQTMDRIYSLFHYYYIDICRERTELDFIAWLGEFTQAKIPDIPLQDYARKFLEKD